MFCKIVNDLYGKDCSRKMSHKICGQQSCRAQKQPQNGQYFACEYKDVWYEI